jgi:hypothetical protein
MITHESIITRKKLNKLLMTAREKLLIVYKSICAASIQTGNKRYEGVYICDNWKTFDGFYKDNIQRYYKAVKKWKNYKRITNANNNKKCNLSNVWFVRKVKDLGYTKKNTCFTSPSDKMKFHKTSKKILLDKRVLGTRDVINILKKKGIKVSNTSVITSRMNKKLSPFMTENRLKKWKWKGVYMSLQELAKKENISHSLLKNRVCRKDLDLKKEVEYCKNYKDSKHLFEGNYLLPIDICRILSKRTGIKLSTLKARFYKWDGDFNKMIIEKSVNKFAPYPKKIFAEKNGETFEFDSIKSASRKLKISSGNLSAYANGKRTGKLKGYTFSIQSHPNC